MAEPTFVENVGERRTLNHAQIHGGGENVLTNYGYQNFTLARDKAGNQVHNIVGTGVHGDTYDLAPVGSTYTNRTTGRKYTHLYNDEGSLVWAVDAVVVPLSTDDDMTGWTLSERGLISVDTNNTNATTLKIGAAAADGEVTIS